MSRESAKKAKLTLKDRYGDDYYAQLGSRSKGSKKPNAGFASNSAKASEQGKRVAERWRDNPELHPRRIHAAKIEEERIRIAKESSKKYRRPTPEDFRR